MKIDWRVFLTPEFLIGAVVVGLLVNVVSAYVVRSLDWFAEVLPASYRRARDAESARVQQLADAAVADHAIYAALAAEASRFRTQQLLHFFFSFACFSALLFLAATGSLKPGMGVGGVLLLIFLVAMGFFQYGFGLDKGKYARRLDAALHAVRRKLNLPVMD